MVVVCMQIIATLYFSVSDILMGVAQVILASVGLTEDVECYNYIYYDYCDDPVIKIILTQIISHI